MAISDSTTKSVAAEAARLGLNDVELAALIGASLPTARALRGGHVPQTTRLERAVTAFLARAARARSRADLTLAPAT